jgi:hypothetical protein
MNATDDPAVLPDPLDANDHLYAVFTTVAPPEPTDGCQTVGAFATGATAGTPGSYTPAGAMAPNNITDMIAGVPATVVASPTTAWTTGQHVILGNGTHANWNGTAWELGDG